MDKPLLEKRSPARHCAAVNSEGKPCSAQPTSTSPFCFWHDPERKEEQILAASKGGLSARPRPWSASMPDPKLRCPRDVVELLEKTVGACLRGELSPQLANAAAYGATVALKGIEVEISDRLDRLEKQIKSDVRVIR